MMYSFLIPVNMQPIELVEFLRADILAECACSHIHSIKLLERLQVYLILITWGLLGTEI